MKKRIIVICSIIFLASLYILLFKTKIDLEDYKGTNISENEKIVKIIKELKIDYKSIILEKMESPYGINIVLNSEYKYIKYELYANKLFYLIDLIEYVSFEYDDEIYKINRNISFDSLKDIDNYYKGDNFDKYEYLGTIKGYKVFDKSNLCVNEKQFVGSDEKYNYYVFCSDISNIYLIGKDEINLKSAIENNFVTMDDIKNLNIKLTEEGI